MINKDDALHDPKLDDRYIDLLINAKGSAEFRTMREVNASAFKILESAFAKQDFQLVDFKLELGSSYETPKHGLNVDSLELLLLIISVFKFVFFLGCEFSGNLFSRADNRSQQPKKIN